MSIPLFSVSYTFKKRKKERKWRGKEKEQRGSVVHPCGKVSLLVKQHSLLTPSLGVEEEGSPLPKPSKWGTRRNTSGWDSGCLPDEVPSKQKLQGCVDMLFWTRKRSLGTGVTRWRNSHHFYFLEALGDVAVLELSPGGPARAALQGKYKCTERSSSAQSKELTHMPPWEGSIWEPSEMIVSMDYW